jgi:hypothetical protein
MGIYLGATELGGGGGAGGGGMLKQHIITTSGTLDLTTLGIANGATIGLFLVGGGGGGDTGPTHVRAGFGGNMWLGSVVLGTAGTVTATIGAGGAANSGAGGSTSITGGGLPATKSTGQSPVANATYYPASFGGSAGYVIGGSPAHVGNSYEASSQYGINGYGAGGGCNDTSLRAVIPNTGRGGGVLGGSGGEYAGSSGVIIIYYL